jgi:hypothetical protein
MTRGVLTRQTDAMDGLEFGNPDRPEANNLLTIYQLVCARTHLAPLLPPPSSP